MLHSVYLAAIFLTDLFADLFSYCYVHVTPYLAMELSHEEVVPYLIHVAAPVWLCCMAKARFYSYDTMVLLVFIGGNMWEIRKACDANT
jgi:hypothetical protein